MSVIEATHNKIQCELRMVVMLVQRRSTRQWEKKFGVRHNQHH